MLSFAVSLSNWVAPLGGGDERGVGLAHALRLARRARRVEHPGNVVGLSLGHLRVEESGIRAVEFAADLRQPLVARHVGVVAQAARVVVIDVRERRHLRLRLEQLVDLLLILDDRVDDAGVVQDVDELGGGRVLVHRHRHAADGLGGNHRPVEPRAVVADDREVHPALETLRSKTAGERAHFGGNLGPGPGLPDAEVFLTGGGRVRPQLRVVQQEPRKRVLPLLHAHSSDANPSLATGVRYAAGRLAPILSAEGSPRETLGRAAMISHAGRGER